MAMMARSIALALLLSANAAAIFTHGVFGAGPISTAAYLIVLTATLLVLGRWNRPTMPDYIAFALLAACGLSVAVHPPPPKYIIQLVLCLAGYAAARGSSASMQNRAFYFTIVAIVTAGTIATLFAFGTDATEAHGKPMVFGQFDAAPIQFTMLLGLALFSMLTTREKLPLLAVFTAIPVCAFAASGVRAALIALMVSLGIGFVRATSVRRRFLAILAVTVASIAVGAFLEKNTTMLYAKYAADSLGIHNVIEAQKNDFSPLPATECENVNLRNSIDIRKQLYKEAFASIRDLNLTGIGIGRFAHKSCVDTEVHNTVLQTAIELGVPAALLLVALVFFIGYKLWLLGGKSNDAIAALCSLSLAALLSLAHGIITDSSLLFLTLGYGAATIANEQNSSVVTDFHPDRTRPAEIQPQLEMP